MLVIQSYASNLILWGNIIFNKAFIVIPDLIPVIIVYFETVYQIRPSQKEREIIF